MLLNSLNMKKCFTVVITIFTAIAWLQAQTTLIVKETNGLQSSYGLSNIRKLTFPPGDSLLVKTKNSNVTYSLSNISNFNFSDTTTAIYQNTIQENDVLLFPNPVSGEFQISFQSDKAGVILMDIIDMQGKIAMQQTLSDQVGKNVFTINVTVLPQGLYVCRVQNGNSFENVKFIKN